MQSFESEFKFTGYCKRNSTSNKLPFEKYSTPGGGIKEYTVFKGAWDNFNINPTFFSKKIEISISSEAYACKMTTC